METVVSGIRASGKLHIGNYLGALKQFVELQNSGKYVCFFFIADLHALTTPFDPKQLSNDTLEVAAEYLAAGIDPEKSTFFVQSHVAEHAELAWIFQCLTPLGELSRMTQFREKVEQLGVSLIEQQRGLDQKIRRLVPKGTRLQATMRLSGNINTGLLTYPTLMASDILIYKPAFVPVGEDQMQHLELTRIIARKFNNRFDKTFPEPKNILMKPLRIMSLADPTKKMSKTGDEALLLSDSPDEIHRKLKKAVTATDADAKSPGVENLMLLLSHFGTSEQHTHFQKELGEGTIKYSELKETLAKQISEYFAEFRERKRQLTADKKKLTEVLAEGSQKAKAVSSKTLEEVKQKIGLL